MKLINNILIVTILVEVIFLCFYLVGILINTKENIEADSDFVTNTGGILQNLLTSF